jgi:hypothetical protein
MPEVLGLPEQPDRQAAVPIRERKCRVSAEGDHLPAGNRWFRSPQSDQRNFRPQADIEGSLVGTRSSHLLFMGGARF